MFIENKITVITGGTSGIGLAAARQFFKEDARLSRPGAANSRTGLASKDPGSASLPGRRDRRQAGLETSATSRRRRNTGLDAGFERIMSVSRSHRRSPLVEKERSHGLRH